MIESAVGPVSAGFCQNCGEVRAFKNSIDYEAEWTNRRDVARSKVVGPPGAPAKTREMAGSTTGNQPVRPGKSKSTDPNQVSKGRDPAATKYRL
jgi:hypothetical protein